MTDADGNYFYNVRTTTKWDILTCYTGRFRHISRDRWEPRRDRNGDAIVGAKLQFHISAFRTEGNGADICYVMEGTIVDTRILETSGRIRRIGSEPGAIFYCNPRCYAEFFEPKPDRKYRGPVLFYDRITEACPVHFDPARLALLEGYEGPPLARKRPAGSNQPGQGPGDHRGKRPSRPADGPPPPRPR